MIRVCIHRRMQHVTLQLEFGQTAVLQAEDLLIVVRFKAAP
jgi:hypothetical protein